MGEDGTLKMESKRSREESMKGTIIQIGLCIIGNLAQVSSGLSMGFSAVALPYMSQEGGEINVSKEEASWIASLAAITVPIGCLVSGPILDRWGRKMGILLVNLPFFVGWLLVAVQPNIYRIYLGRALTGFGTGLASTPATIYFAEVATSSLRGFLISGTSIAISTGVLAVYILGYILQENWKGIAFFCALFPVVAALLVAVMVPESPTWLLSKGRQDEACLSLKLLRGASSANQIQDELDSMTDKQKSNRRNASTFLETLANFKYPQVYKPFIIMNMFFFFQQFSGIFVVIFYAVEVVRNSGIDVDPFLVSIMIGLIRLFFTIIAAWSSKHYGRRPTAIVSGAGMTVSLFFLIFHLYNSSAPPLPAHKPHFASTHNSTDGFNATVATMLGLNSTDGFNASDVGTANSTMLTAPSAEVVIAWSPLVALLVYVLASTIGFLTLPWAMIGEVYPAEVRGVASGFTTCVAYIASFITVKAYPIVLDVLHQSGVFFVFGITALAGTIFVYMFLPETQGKSLREVEAYFTKTGKNKNTPVDLETDGMVSSNRKPIIIQKAQNK
ncbi:facilitated trehalose transporter Tret1-2 homolog isoform X2 [Nilaparvata lugens]|uniref:facilitated trehalose transporter Tret1-2 homolog isoform X2 n=1 Tax=Nilaparvata lugens TaxID=108931 RepID=UPI00193D5AEE|nr:facilitated trehalose transporter Tret1-2 homolog isoform X2 [Nilaparvata lugens]